MISILKALQQESLVLRCFIIMLLGLYTFYFWQFPPERYSTLRSIRPIESIGMEPPKRKVIYILLDAMTFAYSNSTEEVQEGKVPGRFNIFQKKVENEPNNTVFFRNLAEGPTYTANGVLSTLTGGIPNIGIENFLARTSRREHVLEGLNNSTNNYLFSDWIFRQYGIERESDYIDQDITLETSINSKQPM